MCRTSKKAKIYEGTDKEEEINFYYAEAAAYARRISAGNFRGKNAKYKPIFCLDRTAFSSELKAPLVERTHILFNIVLYRKRRQYILFQIMSSNLWISYCGDTYHRDVGAF